MESTRTDQTVKTCLALLIISDARIAARHRVTLKVAGYDVRRVTEWSDGPLEFDPEVLIVQLPGGDGRAADIATRLRAKARFSPVILFALSPSIDFDSERREGRHSGFDEVFPIHVEPTILLARLQQLLVVRPPVTPCVTNPSAA
jgi:DNA-binding response OmpR family regulator